MLKELVAKIEAHLAWRASIGRPMAESTFGRLAVNDGKLVSRLRAGRQITMAKADALKAWMRNDRVQHSKEAA